MTEDKQGRGGCGKLGESKCKGPGARASLLCVCAYVCVGGGTAGGLVAVSRAFKEESHRVRSKCVVGGLVANVTLCWFL